MEMGEKLILTSPGFPECCPKDFAYYIQCSYSGCGFNILFIDVDIPTLSSLEVYDGWSSQSTLLTSALLHDGVWSRPSLVVTSENVSIILNVHKHEKYADYAGVKVQIQAFNTERMKETAAVTSPLGCGSINMLEEWKGGEIKLTPGTSDISPPPSLDCVWVMKTPREFETLHAFIRFTHTLDLYGILEVRGGTHSNAPILLYMDARDGRSMVMQGDEGFNSEEGLYIRLRKPHASGSLSFVYGLFARETKADKHGTCEFRSIDGEVKRGFHCSDISWCIPAKDRCDGIHHCGGKQSQDETRCIEATTRTPTTHHASTTTEAPTACLLWQKRCPDGSCVILAASKCPGDCWTWERRCPDGSCLLQGLQCPGACRTWETKCPDGSCILGTRCPKMAGICSDTEKKCEDGSCVDMSRYCEEERCPDEEPFRCEDKCYNEKEKCNGYEYCDDGSDESFCSIPSLTGSSFVWIAISALLLSIMGASFIMFQIRRKYLHYGSGPPPIGGDPNSPSRMGVLGESDSLTIDVSDSLTAPLTDAPAPPPYTEAMDCSYNPAPPPKHGGRGNGGHGGGATGSGSSGACAEACSGTLSLPPSYEEAACAVVLPPKSSKSESKRRVEEKPPQKPQKPPQPTMNRQSPKVPKMAAEIIY